MEKQLITGFWDEEILRFTPESTLNAIKYANSHVLKGNAHDTVWFTMIALKILRNNFAKEAPKYVLIEKKAKSALKLNFPDLNIDGFLKNLSVPYKAYVPQKNELV